MKTHCFLRSAGAVVMAVSTATGAAAQDRLPDLVLEGEFATVEAPEIVKFQEFDTPPTPPEGFMERFHAWRDSLGEQRRTLPRGDTKPAGPPPGTETSPMTTRGPVDFKKLVNIALAASPKPKRECPV